MRNLLTLTAFALATSASAQETQEYVTPASVVAAAQPEEWVAIKPDDLLIMELAPAEDGSGRYVVIQLMPPPFSQPWVENIRTLARAGWWDGLSIYRSVDNWVVQWGDVTEEKALPEGVVSPDSSYVKNGVHRMLHTEATPILSSDTFAPQTRYWQGWPIASGLQSLSAWPIHCYAHVGVARDLAPDTGTGSELYAVIGHAPRQLDRNIAVVGRVIEGMQFLSTLPRGTGEAGVYESREEDTPIVSVRLASDHPDGATFAYEYLDTASESFARYVHVLANRNDAFYTVPAGGVDICNVQVPVRLVEE